MILVMLDKSIVKSHLDYCCIVWAPYKKGVIEALEKIQTRDYFDATASNWNTSAHSTPW